ncbi:hypothetical protein Actkin_05680 [Actinokineospora sp. UTMC 2448]|nr:hypothetical protein Actkin_05680 [Actinokineospora sp. UTMC 2448]
MVDAETREELQVDVPGEAKSGPGGSICIWQDRDSGMKLALRIVTGHDPLREVLHPEAVSVEMSGFPAKYPPERGATMCEVYVRTAPDRGFGVAYSDGGKGDGDLCASAVAVAERVAETIKV